MTAVDWLRARSETWSNPILENKWRIMLSGPTLAASKTTAHDRRPE